MVPICDSTKPLSVVFMIATGFCDKMRLYAFTAPVCSDPVSSITRLICLPPMPPLALSSATAILVPFTKGASPPANAPVVPITMPSVKVDWALAAKGVADSSRAARQTERRISMGVFLMERY